MTTKPRGLAKFWREIRRPYFQILTKLGNKPYQNGNPTESFFPIRDKFCPICRISTEAFLPGYYPVASNIICPNCWSQPRHRFFWLYFEDHLVPLWGADTKVLHFAPEHYFLKEFERRLGDGYYPCDIEPEIAKYLVDITDIQYPEAFFDFIVCFHVLEHVPDDRKALSELFRVLKKGGTLFLMVPLRNRPTDEDLSVVDPLERQERFFQSDHVRAYGPDIVERIRDANFTVSVLSPDEYVSSKSIRALMNLPPIVRPDGPDSFDPELLFIAKK